MDTETKSRSLTLDIEGMTCSACVARLQSAFDQANGVENARVNLMQARANLTIDSSMLQIPDVCRVVENAGFSVGQEQRIFDVEGMHCSACTDRVRKELTDQDGVLSAEVNLALERAYVTVINHVFNENSAGSALHDAGYEMHAATAHDHQEQVNSRAQEKEIRLLTLAGVACIPFVIQMIATFFEWDEIHMMPVAELVLATMLQVIIGARFYRSAYSALRNGYANMDVLVALGTTSAYLFSWYLMVSLGEAAEGELYFEASAIILTLVLTGKFLENKAKRAGSKALRELFELRPREVRVQTQSGEWEVRPSETLLVGELFQCRPGDRIAADGFVVRGISSVDESLVTGESLPKTKRDGDLVVEGAINLDGSLEIEATAVGKDSTVSRIAQLIESVQAGKLGIQRLVDRVSGVFVPIVMSIAAVVFVGWLLYSGSVEQSLINAVSVLVIACPCALGLATPTAIMTGTGAAAKAGILFRELDVLETTRSVKHVAFDKTGTLTRGEPRLTEISLNGDLTEDEILRLATSVQEKSEHPYAKAFREEASKRGILPLDADNFKSIVACGVVGDVDSKHVAIGNARLLRTLEVETADLSHEVGIIYMIVDDTLVASFRVSDTVRDEAKAAVAELHRRGIKTWMISGDDIETANAIAKEVEIDHVKANLTPESKLMSLEEIAASGERVAMVGDGINDGPALQAADVGIAMSTGTQLAMEVASVSLMRTDLRLVAATIDASEVTFRKIAQNLFWAFIYNLIALPLAAFGYLSPTIAGAAMAFSSISVVLNSLWLRRWRPKLD